MINRLDFKIPPELNFNSVKPTENYGKYKFYLWWLSNKSRRHTTIKRTKIIIKLLDLKQESKVLDEGCGWGYTTLLLAKNGFNSIGIDTDVQQLTVANQIANYNNIKAKFINCDVKDTIFSDKEFDAVIQIETLEHLGDDWDRSIKEIYRILKDDGQIIISTPNARGLAQIIKSWLTNFKLSKQLDIGDKDTCISQRTLESKLNECNIKVVKKKLVLFAIPFIPNFLFPLNLFFEFVIERLPILREIATTYIFYCKKNKT